MEEEVPGAMGTSASLALRLGQITFSSASLLFMSFRIEFYSFTSYCFLVTIMGLVIPWSTALALLDAYSIFLKSLPRRQRIMLIIIIGDWVLSFLSLAAACSTASVTNLLVEAGEQYWPLNLCRRYQLSAATAFFSWFLSFGSSLFNLWVLPSL
ncbi:hypothetical protein Patl1_28834 [Pistacia atlantica]|uniref:Uncharacterized protein n=1 Tax=Pistacia atlantica TaxID=434234 RepID=A0ACC1BEG2_9ROSI|nr:hypothetical protein Patl1_28834 [Pistacia atlantica]